MPGRGSILRSELIASGYETAAAKPESTLALVDDYIPDAVIFEPGGPVQESDHHILALARGLRSEASTYVKRLRTQNGGRITIPILLLVPEEETEVRNEAMSLGVHRVMSSDYDPAELLSNIRAAGNGL
jgi:DNA-binding NarL/FixJ family response regulator